MQSFTRRTADRVARSRAHAQSVVEYVLALTAVLVTGAAAMGLYTGALQQAFQRLVGHVNGI